jgi:transposase
MGFKRLTDAEWEMVEICMPEQHRGRPRFVSDRACLDALLYILSTGCRWSELPREFPPKSTVFQRYGIWIQHKTLQKVFKRLRLRMPLSQVFYLDATTKSAKKGGQGRTSRKSQRQQNKCAV